MQAVAKNWNLNLTAYVRKLFIIYLWMASINRKKFNEYQVIEIIKENKIILSKDILSRYIIEAMEMNTFF